MTQNSWPQDGSSESPDADRQFSSGQDATFPSAPNPTPPVDPSWGGDSKSQTAKDEAGDVATHAKDAAQSVTDTAKDEAANVAAEAKTNARDLLEQAKADLTEQAGTQQQKVAEGLRSVSDELHSLVDGSDQSGMATDFVRQAAERSSSVASWLDERDPGSLLDEVKSFAREKPGTFLLLAAGAGVLAGRLSRSLSAGAPDSTASTKTRADTTEPMPPAPLPVPPVPGGNAAMDTGVTGTTDAYSQPPSRFDTQPGFDAQPGFDTQSELGEQHRFVSEPGARIDRTEPVDPLDPYDGGQR